MNCPWCHGETFTLDLGLYRDGVVWVNDRGQFQVSCERCEARGPLSENEESAREAWENINP